MPVDDLSIILLLNVREGPRRKKLQTKKRMKIKMRLKMMQIKRQQITDKKEDENKDE